MELDTMTQEASIRTLPDELRHLTAVEREELLVRLADEIEGMLEDGTWSANTAVALLTGITRGLLLRRGW